MIANRLTPTTLPAQEGAQAWHSEVVRSDDALDRLAQEWDDLASRCITATPFQSSAWLRSWWRHYGRPGALVVVLVRRAGTLVGAAALQRRGPLGGLANLGGDLVDFTDVLLDDRYTDLAAGELARALPLRRPWHSLDLREVHPHAALQKVFEHWHGRRHRLVDSVCQYLPALPMDDLLKRLPSRAGQRARNRQRRTSRVGVEVRPVPTEEVPDAVAELLELHVLQWKDRDITPEHRTERFAAHLIESTSGLHAAGAAALHRYWLDGRMVAVDLVLLCRPFGCFYLYGAHPSLRERLDIATLLFGAAVDELRARQIPTLSLLRGDEPYKRNWRPDRLRNQRLVLGPGFAPFAAARAARVRVRQTVVRVMRARLPWGMRTAKAIAKWAMSMRNRRVIGRDGSSSPESNR